VRNNTDTRSSTTNQASCTSDWSHPLGCSRSFSSSAPISLFLIHNSTIIAEHKVTSSPSITPCHDHELTPTCSIHWVQHPPRIVWLPFILMSTSWPQNVASASVMPPYMIDHHQPALHVSSKVKLPCHIPMDASSLTDEYSLSTQCDVHRPPPSTRPISLDDGLQSSSPNLLDYGLQVRPIMSSKVLISELPRWRPPSASPNWVDYSLQVHLQPCSITASKCISKLAQSQSQGASLSSLVLGLQVYLQIRSITASKCISKLALSRPRSGSLTSLHHHFQAHLGLLSRTACSQSWYTVCRLVAI